MPFFVELQDSEVDAVNRQPACDRSGTSSLRSKIIDVFLLGRSMMLMDTPDSFSVAFMRSYCTVSTVSLWSSCVSLATPDDTL